MADELTAAALRNDALLIEQRADMLSMVAAEGWQKQATDLQREAQELRKEADKLELGNLLAHHFLRLTRTHARTEILD